MKYVVIYKSVNDKVSRKEFDTSKKAHSFVEKLKGNKLLKEIYPITME